MSTDSAFGQIFRSIRKKTAIRTDCCQPSLRDVARGNGWIGCVWEHLLTGLLAGWLADIELRTHSDVAWSSSCFFKHQSYVFEAVQILNFNSALQTVRDNSQRTTKTKMMGSIQRIRWCTSRPPLENCQNSRPSSATLDRV